MGIGAAEKLWRSSPRPGYIAGQVNVPGWQSFEGELDARETYLYKARCPISGAELSLPRTPSAERLAVEAARTLELSEGKMVGVLLVRDAGGNLGFGRAFSGQLRGQLELAGWAPPLHLPTPTPSEESTLQRLAQWKAVLSQLQEHLLSHPHHAEAAKWQQRENSLREELKRNKSQRKAESADSEERSRQGRADSLRWRDFLKEKKAALQRGQEQIGSLRAAISEGKAQRKALSKSLQAEMHQQMSQGVTSFLGRPPETLFPHGIPTGTGDCCAPKLLAWAARHDLRPLALAEVWWGPESLQNKAVGEFYPPCVERCEALMGPLLSLALREPIELHHLDEHLVVVEKPSGLLTVPGRYHWNQDSLLTRLERRFPGLLPVHRLDLETSGLVVFARTAEAQVQLRRQFEEQSVEKCYRARLDLPPKLPQGDIDIALSADRNRPGCYRLDPQGRPAITHFRHLEGDLVELRPTTGRSHQLRVHMAHGLKAPIRGDRLYGSCHFETLKLRCVRLSFLDPKTRARRLFSVSEQKLTLR